MAVTCRQSAMLATGSAVHAPCSSAAHASLDVPLRGEDGHAIGFVEAGRSPARASDEDARRMSEGRSIGAPESACYL